MVKTVSYKQWLIERLKKDPDEAAGYLNAALEEEHSQTFLIALRDVAEAYGGIAKIAKKTKLNRENLYRMLSKNGNPELYSLAALLEALGFKLTVEVKMKKAS